MKYCRLQTTHGAQYAEVTDRGGRLWRALQAQALLDASFAVGHRGNGRFEVARVIGASIPQWMCWVGGTAVGLLAAPSAHLMHALGADVTRI